jgi:transposase-like protein
MGVIALSTQERKRLELVSRVKEGVMKLVKAAELCGLSYRQMKRVWKRYQEEGDAGLAHHGRGRTSNRRIEDGFRESVLKRYAQRYPDFGPTLASEYLTKEGLKVDHETLRRWLLAARLWQKKRKRQKHRQWRERRAHRGELIQMDGSHHDWFEGRRAWAVLMVMIDDATNRTYARFYEAEDTRAAMDLFGRYARRDGLPQALYVDHDSIYECTRQARIDEDLRGEEPQTQFERAMKTLAVEIIEANSPQAKGRVERRNGVFQDRLVKAMRLEGIYTIEAANRYLDEVFLPDLNRRFTVRARECADLHRPIPAGLQLKEVLCFEEPRVVQNDWTVRWRNRYFQIARQHEALHLARRTVTIRERLDGSVVLLYRGQFLRHQELPSRPVRLPILRLGKPRTPQIPSADHPWRRHAAVARPVRPISCDVPGGPFSERGEGLGLTAAPLAEKGTFLMSPNRGHF